MSNLSNTTNQSIETRIFKIREAHVMVDFHLAELFQGETKRLNEQVKRNIKRFPTSFMFQLTENQWDALQSQIATAEKTNNSHIANNQSQFATSSQKHRSKPPFVFTEQGVAMLSAVLNSDIAINVSIQIIEAFVNMRQILLENSLINLRLNKLEHNQIISEQNFEKVFKALENKSTLPTQGVFFDGQIFDAYQLTSKIIRSAKKSIVLIDNYIDETTLTQLAKKEKDVKAILLTKNRNKSVQLDVKKANEQYGNFTLQVFNKSHDRFLIIDQTEVYHLGTSLKDLGKKWFAFSKLNKTTMEDLLNSISNL